MICLALTGPTLAENFRLLQTHAAHIDLAELRIDLLAPGEQVMLSEFLEMVAHVPGGREGTKLPIIGTVRRDVDGGSYTGAEQERQTLLEQVIGSGFTYVDLEADLRESAAGQALADRARSVGCEIIRSIHDLVAQPTDPAAVVRRLCDDGREIARLAVTPRSTSDLVALLRAADDTPDVRKILTGMGPHGNPLRILSRRFGSMFTYVDDSGNERSVTPYIGPQEMDQLYRFRDISSETRIFGIIGSPIAHSRSPEYHNRRFAADRLDACYLSFLVDDVSSFFQLAALLPVCAFSVTSPHKEAVLPFLAEVDAGTTAAGSCNTIVPRVGAGPTGEKREWAGVNTDVPGFLGPLLDELGEIGAGRGATVIGAGGAARAVVFALLGEGLRVLVVNRSSGRATGLVSDLQAIVAGRGTGVPASLRARALSPDTDITGYRDVIVQTTNLGMHGAGDPAPWLEFDGSELVYDIVYTPPETPFILRARAAGCRTVTGDRMFRAQAEAQYKLFSLLAVS
jgi:3-dehydroquinate dehydratase / shikimate dehydrogenase